MPHQSPLQPGDPRRVGRYRLAGRITGIPAEGPIYLGTGPDGSEVTISVLHSEWTKDAAARDRFAAEAAVAKRVPPFCAARILDAGLDGDDAFLISEYVPGKSLIEVIATDGTLDGPELEAAAVGMATGLASIHLAGLVHGNFGPEYVIMTAAGPRVVEFGITPPYGAATPAADMAAWAQTVVFAASGKPPTTMADLDVLPSNLRDVVIECLSANPADRPAARAAVIAMIGDQDPPAGVLAEGSRRAVPGGDPRARQDDSLLAQRGSGLPWAAAGVPPGGRLAVGRPPDGRPGLDRPSGPRPAGIHATGSRATGPRPIRPAEAHAGGRPPSDRGSGPRPAVSRHGRGDDVHRPPAHAPAQSQDRHGAHQQSLGRRRAGQVLIAAGVLVCALLVLLVVHLVQNTGSRPQASSASNDQAAHSSAPSRSPSASPTPTAVTPSEFAGSWAGRVSQLDSSYNVTINLTAGTAHGSIGYSGSDLSCAGELVLMTRAADKLTLSQSVSTGPCLAGTVTLTKAGSGSVQFNFSGSSGPPASGTLSKS
jgi:eukaryotic-like serine/threonine-protein kinase